MAKEKPKHCLTCKGYNTKAYGPQIPVCYQLGATLNGVLVGKKITPKTIACSNYEELKQG